MNSFFQKIQSRLNVSLPVLIGGAVIILLLLGSLIWLLVPGKSAEVREVKRGDITVAVYGQIRVEPIQEVLVRSRSTGTIQSIEVKEGDLVSQNQMLAQISDEQDANALNEARLQLQTAEERQKIGPPSATELATKQTELEQLGRLLREGNIAPIEYERVESQIADLKARLAQERLNLANEVSMAEQRIKNIETRVLQGQIRSPIHGQVLGAYAQLGAAVLTQSQLFLIGSQDCHLKATVNEEDVGQVQVGMSAMVRLFSHPDQNFEAEVTEILPQGDNQSYGVILVLNDPPDKLLPGMTGEANIITGNRTNTIICPTRGIRDGNQVYVVEGRRVVIREVEVGYRSVKVSEILSGLKVGDHVIVSEHDRFSPGDRVSKRIK